MKIKNALFSAVLGLTALALPAAAAELSGEGQIPGSKIVVTSVKRDAANTVTLRFQLINDGEGKVKTYEVLGSYFSLDKLALVDSANKKKYLVVKDSSGECVCSQLKDDVDPGTRFNLWAKFPAPAAEVQTITVVIPGFEPVDAPITAAP
jgi:hypothetical protein